MTMERRKRPRSSSAVAFKPKEDDHRKAFSNNFPRRKSSTAKISLRFRDLSLLLFTAVSTVILPAHVSGASPNTREILEQLYDATNGDGWKENKNWKSTEDVCSWQGVHCDKDGGEVIRVELDRNNLSGDIPPEFWKLPKLKHVNMRSNLLTDGGFDGLAASTSENSDPQGSRSPIQLLILSENQLTSLEGIGNAKDTLQFVNLNKNQIDASIPDEVFQLTNLKTLYLAFNQLTSTLPTGIGKLTKLTEVYAFRNRLSGQLPSELGLLDKCQILGLGNNLWSGTLPTELNDMVNLRDLSIHNNGHGHEASTGVESDAPPEHLEPAGISGPLLSFGNVPYLGLLYLDGNDLSGTIPPDFLRHNNNTDSPVSVGLSSNNITGEIPKALERFESLSLDLVGNSIDSIPPELCEKGGWMGGLVEEYKCDAIMCPIGTYSSEGRQIGTDSECRKCDDDFPYFGASQCFSDDANQQPWEVLAFFYLSTGGDKWENKDGWEIFDNLFNGETLEELEQIDVDICNGWYGILCRDGVPERLSLPKNNLFGVVPNMIFHIDWSVFDLSDNNVEFESLSAVPKTVESLILSNAKVRSLDGIAGLSNLEQLYLDGLEIQGELPNALFALTELKTLHLQHGKFQGPLSSAIGSLVNLEVLNIYGNALSGKLPSEIGALARLRALDLSENRFTGTLPNEIAKLTNITNFALHQTKGSLGGPLPAFDTLPLLKGLYLQSNGFTGQIAENFIGGINDKTSEIVISLSSNQLTGSIPPSLVKFDNLILDLENNGITELDSTICVHDQWMRGELGNLPQASRCNGILCPPGTWNAFGKETAEEKCRECSEGSENFGQTRCGDEQEKSHEKEILDRLFAMTGGRYWTKPHENWLKPGASVCEREGIVCSGSGDEEHVHEIALNDFGLRGTIPTSIWELSHANRLKFSFNAVSVSFEGIAKASRLRILDMSYCHLRSLEGIEDAPSELVEIHFTANQFQGSIPTEIFELTSLNRLFLNNNHFTSRIPPDVSKLTGLDTILLGGNKFTGAVPSEIGLMTNLQVLGLAQNDLFGNLPSEIENLSLLKNLYLSQQNGNQFDGPFPSFSKNSKLVTIDASGNSFSGSLPKDFLIMVDPRAHIEVNLANNAFVGSIPESWSLFETLDIDLSGNQLTALPEKLCSENGWNGGRVGLLDTCDAILCPPGTHLTGLGRQVEPLEPCQACEQGVESAPFYGTRDCLDPKLVWERKILVSFYEATNGTSWLSQRNWLSLKPVCIWYGIVCDENGFVETVQLEDNFLVSGREQIEDVSNILTLRELKTLDLKGNELVLDFEAIKTDKTKLVFLRLSGVGLSSLEGISKAANLKALHVTNNQITAIPDELYSMDSLESVFLSFNSIKGPISPKIGQLTNLIELYLFGNFLSGTIPTEIGLMTSLAEFVAAHNLLSGDLPDQISFLPNLEQLSMYSQQGIEMLKGPIPSFSGAPRLWYFDASDNALTGPVPDNFLINSIHLNETVTVLLQDNQITGTIPRELSKFNLMDINLAGNAIERIPEALCSIDGWMQGDVGRIGNCSAILCPRGTFNQFGYHSPEYPCLECSHLVDIEMLGQTHCENFTSERDTLEKFFDDTGGEFWLNSTNWNTEAPICSWFGILCEDGDVQDSEGVTHIKLESNGLDGELSSEIWTLPALRSLKLDGNEALFMNLKGIANAADTLEVLTLAHVKMPFVEGLGSLTSLKKLSLAGNELTGTFPDELFMLSNSLESLYIGFNLLYGPLPTRLGEMTQLQVFNAFNNDFFSTIPTEVASMENLRTLVLSENLIYGAIPQEMSSMPSLRGFAVDRGEKSGPRLSGTLPSFDQNPQLIYLYLQGNELQGKIPNSFLSSSNNARFVGLSSNLLTGEVPSELGFLSLLDIALDDNEIVGFPDSFCDKGDWMAGAVRDYGCEAILCPPGTSSPRGRAMNKTTECQACADPVSASFYGSTSCDEAMSEREILVNLYNGLEGDNWYRNDFWLTNSNMCDWYGIACANGKVIEINLRGNNLRGLPPPDIFHLRELQILWLYSNPITFSFENIGRAHKLQDLRLDATKLHSLHGIGAATSLVSFDARFTDIKGAFPEEILRMTNLRVLSLGHNSLTGTLPKSFEDLRYLLSLRLNSNRFSGSVPGFDGAHFLKHIDLSDNQLTGALSKRFLSKISEETPVSLRLSNNQLTGVIPEEFDRFGRMSLYLSANRILGMPLILCDNSEWNGGDVGSFGCDGILCKPGTYNPLGRQIPGLDCLDCASAVYYGETSCRLSSAASERGALRSLLGGALSLSALMVIA